MLCRRREHHPGKPGGHGQGGGLSAEKETITGAEMVAIIEGRDPSTVEDAYASTLAHENGFRPSQPEVIEPAPGRST